MKTLKKLATAALLAATLSGFGCAYGGVAASGEWAVVTVNNGLLFGIFNKAYVCKITPQGLTQCAAADSP